MLTSGSKFKVVFLGSPPFAAEILLKLLPQYKPMVVVTPPARPAGRGKTLSKCAVQKVAEESGIEVWTTENMNDPAFQAKLKALNPDIFLVVAFGQILKQSTLDIPKLFSLNVHASLLPRWRGAAPIQYAIWHGDVKTGVSIQKMVMKLDAGDVLVQKEIEIEGSDTAGTLTEKLSFLGGAALLEALKLIDIGSFTFTPQEEVLVTLAPKIEKQQGLIDWKQTAAEVARQVRALLPWPGAYFKLGAENVKILRAETVSGLTLKPGQIQTDHKNQIVIGCGEQALTLIEVQPENKKAMPVRDYLNAFRGNFPYNQVSL